MQLSYLPSLSFIPPSATVKSTILEFILPCATFKSTIPEFHTSLCNRKIYHSRVSNLSVQKANLPSLSLILLSAKVKSTIPEFHISLCNSQIYHPRVSYLLVQQSNLPPPSFILLCATVLSTIPEFHISLCNSQIYHPSVSYLSVQQSNLPSRVLFLSVQQSNLPSPSFIPPCVKVKYTIPEFLTSLCNSQNYLGDGSFDCCTERYELVVYYNISVWSVCSIILPYHRRHFISSWCSSS